MDPARKSKLDSLLKEWKPQVDLPPRFESEVWRRIAASQEKPARWWNFDWLIGMVNQPRLAYAVVLVAMFLGTGLGSLQVEHNYRQQMSTSESRYIHSVDPLSNISPEFPLMKRLLVILALAIVLGSGAYLLAYNLGQTMFCRMPADGEASIWTQQEFHLSDAQYAQVRKLESDYRPKCLDLCAQIAQSHQALKKLILANGDVTPEVEAALQKDNAVQQQCREAMLNHFYEVSRVMPPEQGKRYLEMMETHVVDTERASTMDADAMLR